MTLAAPDLYRCGSGPGVLLLHPLGVDRHFWDHTVAALHEVETLTYDLPGHGSTPPPAETATIEALAEQAADVLSGAGVQRAHVVGVSFGGLVAQALALSHPDVVDHLVIVDAVAAYPEPLRQQWRDRQVSVRKYGMAHLLAPTLELWFTADTLAKGGTEVEYVRRAVLSGNPEGYARACEALEAVDLTGRVAGICASTLVMCGEDDGPPFVAAASWFVDTLPDARLAWLSSARHAGVLEQPEQFLAALRSFLPPVAGR